MCEIINCDDMCFQKKMKLCAVCVYNDSSNKESLAK